MNSSTVMRASSRVLKRSSIWGVLYLLRAFDPACSPSGLRRVDFMSRALRGTEGNRTRLRLRNAQIMAGHFGRLRNTQHPEKSRGHIEERAILETALIRRIKDDQRHRIRGMRG